eukprot:m.238048 g.238048  ORF g.238048 m.238048 type:complete len:479 (-) comp33717_c2_seq1:189-1625(-)
MMAITKRYRNYRRFFILPATFFFAMGICVPYNAALFIYPVQEACPSWTAHSSVMTTAVTLGMVGVSGFSSGLIIDRTGPRILGITGSTLGVVGLCATAYVVQHCTSHYLYYATFGIPLGIHSGFGYSMSVNTVLKWYPGKSGFCGSYIGGALGFGGLIVAQVMVSLLKVYDVPAVMYITAGIIACCNFPFWYFISWDTTNAFESADDPNTARAKRALPPVFSRNVAKVPLKTLLCHARLWVFLFSYWASMLPGWGLLSMLTVYFHDGAGVSKKTAAQLVPVYMVVYAISRSTVGTISDCISRQKLYVTCCAVQAVVFTFLPIIMDFGSPDALFPLCGVVFVVFGGSKVIAPGYINDVFGAANATRIVGMSIISFGSAGCVGSIAISQLYLLAEDHSKRGYDLFAMYSYAMAGVSVMGTIGFAVIPCMKGLKDTSSKRLRANIYEHDHDPDLDVTEPLLSVLEDRIRCKQDDSQMHIQH